MKLPIKRSHLVLVILSIFLLTLMLPLNLGTLNQTVHETITGYQIVPPPYSTNTTLVKTIEQNDALANPQCTWTVSHEIDTSVHINYACPNTYTLHAQAGPLLYLLSPFGLPLALQLQGWLLAPLFIWMGVIWLTVKPRRWVLDMLGMIKSPASTVTTDPTSETKVALAPGEGENADHYDAEKEAEHPA